MRARLQKIAEQVNLLVIVVPRIVFNRPVAIGVVAGMAFSKCGLYFEATQVFASTMAQLIAPTSPSLLPDVTAKKIAAWVGFCFMIRTVAVYGPLTYNRFSTPLSSEGTPGSCQASPTRNMLRIFLIQGTSLATAVSAYFGIISLLADAPIGKLAIAVLGIIMAVMSYCSEKSIGGGAIEKCLDEKLTWTFTHFSGCTNKFLKYSLNFFLFAVSTDEAAAILFFAYNLGKEDQTLLEICVSFGFLGAIATFARTYVLYGPRMGLFKYLPPMQSDPVLINGDGNAPTSTSHNPYIHCCAMVCAVAIMLTTSFGKMFIAIDGFIDAGKVFTQSDNLDINEHVFYYLAILIFSISAFAAELYFGGPNTYTAIYTFLSKIKSLCAAPHTERHIDPNPLLGENYSNRPLTNSPLRHQ